MVGSNPYTCAGAACSTTIQVDVMPIVVNVAGLTFDPAGTLGPTLASPQSSFNDYGSTGCWGRPVAR